jgi:hypothetical protein
MKYPTPQKLSERKALEHMRRGSRLVCIHGNSRLFRWFVVPGGSVTDEIAAKVKRHPSVVGDKDGLFPDHDQTWRMQTFVGAK